MGCKGDAYKVKEVLERKEAKKFHSWQANTSTLMPEVLDDSDVLHETAPEELAAELIKLKDIMNISICGGCCGTDTKHVDAIAKKLTFSNSFRGA